MFCPKCKAEYRPGFTHCADCNEDLVEDLFEPGTIARNMQESTNSKLKSVWSGSDQARCVSLCAQFNAAKIRFRVDEQRQQYLLGVREHYKICVPPEFFEMVRKTIAKGPWDYSDEFETE